MHDQPMPESFTKGQPIAQLQGQKLRCFGPQHPFQRWGRSGQEFSTLLPHIGTATVATRTDMARLAAGSVRRVLAGERPENAVNPEAF